MGPCAVGQARARKSSSITETTGLSFFAAHGFSADLQVPSKNPEVVCRGLNIIFALLQHRQKDMELKKKSEVAVARLRYGRSRFDCVTTF